MPVGVAYYSQPEHEDELLEFPDEHDPMGYTPAEARAVRELKRALIERLTGIREAQKAEKRAVIENKLAARLGK
ncbi:MAG: hypothetical protein OK452_04275 [Thaumarchaeota archaeon]|nr:hypothetical protein [Nitrososphaerota archaeon]